VLEKFFQAGHNPKNIGLLLSLLRKGNI